jgi:Uncharacterized conserved protein
MVQKTIAIRSGISTDFGMAANIGQIKQWNYECNGFHAFPSNKANEWQEERKTVLSLLRRYSVNSTSYLTLEPDKKWFFSKSMESVVNCIYGFEPLYHAKKKYAPSSWEPVYLIYSAMHLKPVMGYALINVLNSQGCMDYIRAYIWNHKKTD